MWRWRVQNWQTDCLYLHEGQLLRSISLPSNSSFFSSSALWPRHRAGYSKSSSISHACIWLPSIHDHRSKTRRSGLITVMQQEQQSFRQLMVIVRRNGKREGRGCRKKKETPLTSQSIWSPLFPALSVHFIMPSWGIKKDGGVKQTEMRESRSCLVMARLPLGTDGITLKTGERGHFL